jgi:hypothetical protein
MANPASFANGTQTNTVGGGETSLATVNAAGTYVLSLDTNALAAGDVLEVRVYKMTLTSGTSRVAYETAYYGAQPSDDLIKVSLPIANTLTDTTAIEFTLSQTFGTARAIPWVIEQYT